MRQARSRWRSEAVNLVLVGATTTVVAAGLGGCSRDTFQRNVYRSAGDCAADYDMLRCQSMGQSDGPVRFLGPIYRVSGGVPSACRSSDPGGGRSWRTGTPLFQAKQPVARGGFGASCPSRSTSRSSSRFWGG